MPRPLRFALALALLIAPGLLGLYAAASATPDYVAAVDGSRAQLGLPLAPLSASRFCRGPLPTPAPGWENEAEAEPPPEVLLAADCQVLLGLPALRVVALVSMLLGACLLLALWWAARAARRDRDKLLRYFRPGLRVAVYGAIAMLLLSGYLLSMSSLAMTQGEAALLPPLLGGICVVAALLALLRVREALHPKPSQYHAAYATAQEHPLLWRFVERLADRLGTARPDTLLLGVEPSFFVTEAAVMSHRSTRARPGRAMHLSLPLMRMLTLPELAAVVGHELGHFRGEDTRYSTEFYPVFAGTQRAIDALYASSVNRLAWIALQPAIRLLELFFGEIEEVEAEISRERELMADAAGAEAASATTLVNSLMKICWADAVLPAAEEQAWQQFQQSAEVRPLSASLAKLLPDPQAVSALLDEEPHWPHPTDSHPPIIERIQALGVNVQSALAGLALPAPELSSLRLVADAEALELGLFRELLEEYAADDEADAD